MRPATSIAAAAVLILALAAPAAAESLSVTRVEGGGYDVDVPGPATATDVLQALSEVTGASIIGAPAVTDVAPAHLRSASLQRAVSALLPHSAFTIRYAADGVTPAAIIFSPPPGQAGSSSAAPEEPQFTVSPAGVRIPKDDRKGFQADLPMLPKK